MSRYVVCTLARIEKVTESGYVEAVIDGVTVNCKVSNPAKAPKVSETPQKVAFVCRAKAIVQYDRVQAVFIPEALETATS